MRKGAKLRSALGGFCLLFLSFSQAADGLPAADTFCRDWFGQTASARPLTLADTNAVISEVTLDGRTAGWLFRTDQVPPVCKGKRGQIAVLVALGTDARIKGLTVLDHKENPAYFKRLKEAFFKQFVSRSVADDAVKLDAVTKATLSSRAIIRDVMEGAKHVIALPEVAAKLGPANKGG